MEEDAGKHWIRNKKETKGEKKKVSKIEKKM